MKYSFIVTCYNEEKYIARCLNSIKNQSRNSIEIIVVNDGSKDDSLKIIKEQLSNYKNAKIIDRNNKGLSYSRNEALSVAKGEYVIFVDGDDYIEKNFIQIIDENLSDDLDIIKFNANYIYENKVVPTTTFYNNHLLNGENAFLELVNTKKVFEPVGLYVYRMSFLKRINYKFSVGKYHEDFGITPLTIITADKVLLLNNNLYNYYQREGSITRSSNYNVILKRSKDILEFTIKNRLTIDKIKLNNPEVRTKYKSFMANAVLSTMKQLNKRDRKDFIKKIKEEKIVQDLEESNIKQKIKKLYLRLRVSPLFSYRQRCKDKGDI